MSTTYTVHLNVKFFALPKSIIKNKFSLHIKNLTLKDLKPDFIETNGH